MNNPRYELGLKLPWMNAAGILGFAPDADRRVDYSCLGVFVTHPVSMSSRTPAHGKRYIPFPGGFLLHTGFPNPGFKAIVRRYRDAWRRSAVPVWVHLISHLPEEVEKMVLSLEELPGVSGIELGLAPDIDVSLAVTLIQAAQGELPLVVQIPLDRVDDLVAGIVKQYPQIVLSLGPPRGKLPVSGSGMLTGRMYGPAVFPKALMALERALDYDASVIAGGGIYTQKQARLMLDAGALAVQLDALIWRAGLQGWHF